MADSPTIPRGDRPTASGAKRPTAPQGSGLPRRPDSLDLRRTVTSWLTDGKAQGWSRETLEGRRRTLPRFAWWLENEAETRRRRAP